MFFYKIASYLVITILLLSCAQIVPLSGGEKDLDHPKEVESSPKNGAINFTEKTITIEFDEFIKLNNVASQLIVSPIMETPPEILVRGKKLVIKLEDELTPNTTYSLNFGNAITDITENNVFPNYKYVFSTGSYIDSLTYSGKVVNAFDLAKKENIYVLLYDQFGDSIPYKELPRYVALTNKEGEFSITNVAHGKYKFFAINDINGNYLFDLPNEEIGFKNKVIALDSSSADNLIYLFEEEGGLQFLDKAENKTYGKVDIIFNQPTKNLTITALNEGLTSPWHIKNINEAGDSLTLWLLTTENVENLELVFRDGEQTIDTTNISIIDRKEFKDTSLQITTNITGSFDLDKNIRISTSRPTSAQDINSILLLEDSNQVVFHIETSDLINRNFLIKYDFKENTNCQLFIPPSTFQDIYGLKNDTVKINFKTKSESDYGIINLSITPNFLENYIVQLYKNSKLIKETFVTLSTTNDNLIFEGKNTFKTDY
ncbi:MAG: Ig-like domain-containing protein, partial [Flavobacteriales bacterium]|nr:Ig-like domain-containing protein [Flavobacteriales bacterium]